MCVCDLTLDIFIIYCYNVSSFQDTWVLFCVQKFVHELRITNQVMYLNPPVEEVRVNIIGELYSWEANILTLSRITHSRYQASSHGFKSQKESKGTFR